MKNFLLFSFFMSFMNISYADSQYEYTRYPIGTKWKSCESKKEIAVRWARIQLKNEANDLCRSLGDGSRFSEIVFDGYHQSQSCHDNKSWQHTINQAIVECKKRKTSE